jgi:penicillin amidase
VLTGEHRTAHVEQSIKLERDAMGVPTIHAQSREDAAYGLGYLHGQDRFFQMDLLRRMTAGRLSELVGKAAVGSDKRFRKHRFGQMAKEIYDDLSVDQKLLVDAYSKGVNEGLHRLEDEPFEYQVLQSTNSLKRLLEGVRLGSRRSITPKPLRHHVVFEFKAAHKAALPSRQKLS